MWKRIVYIICVLFIYMLTGIFCDKKGTNIEVIPLDGRGGGVLAYCYQPLTGNFNHQLRIMNADGSADQSLIEATIGINHEDWSPDAQMLAAVGYVSQFTWSIYRFFADGTGLTRLTTANNVNDTEPNWSPDGTQIVFSRMYPDQNNRSEIWVMDSDGSNQQYIGVEGFAAKWSVDGNRFIYQSHTTQISDLFTCDINGTDIQQITTTASDETMPSYSPDGTQIAYSTNRDGNVEIYVMDADGSNPQRLTNNTIDDYTPRWSPDGSQIAFDGGPFGEWEVFIINSDGTNIRQITDSEENITAINPVWRPEP